MRKRKPNKAQHFQLKWNVFNAVEIVEQYEKQSGDTSGQLPLPVLMKIYQGLKTKGWKGAKEEWLSMMDEEFKGDTCLDAWAVANCLYKGKAA